MITRIVALAALMVATGVAHAADPAKGWTPDTIVWQTNAPNGTGYALLEGNRDSGAAPFSYAFRIPEGVYDTPHSHSATVRVFVAKGALRIGFGSVFDRSRLMTYPAGSYVIVPGGAVHFDGADVDTVIYGTATGPWSTTYLDHSAPASAGTPVKP